MKVLLLFLLWCGLLVLSWPIAMLALVLGPLVWLLSLPLLLLGLIVASALALLRAVFMLPARLRGSKG